MIYTGYYAKLKYYTKVGLVPFAISGKVPDFYKGERIKDFAPRFEMFQRWKNKEISNEWYVKEYKEYLETLDKEEVRKFFDSLAEDNVEAILLCYEKPGDFCHRHIIADWLEVNFGYKVNEYNCNE